MAAKKAKGTEVAQWDEQLAKMAEKSAKMEENTGGGQFFSIKSGQLSWQDQKMPNNQMVVIIVDSILENVYYEGEYDPDTPQGPKCFAFNREEDDMTPHKIVIESGNAQSDMCGGCEHNEFGSAVKGKGKACRNTRRLAMIPAGKINKDDELDMIDDLDHYKSAEVGYMKLPVTSVKGYSTFVKQVATTLKRPPFGIVTLVKVVPDDKSQFKVTFEALSNVPNEFMGAIMKRHEETAAVIDFPYTPFEEDEAPPKKAAKGRAATVVKKRKY